VCCWFLTICIEFKQYFELSPTSLLKIQVLDTKPLSWVERFELCEQMSINSKHIEHFGSRQTLMKHLLFLEVKHLLLLEVKHILLLEVKHPIRLGVLLELPILW
jgi:hypothetical protein